MTRRWALAIPALLFAACGTPGIPDGHGWTCLDFDEPYRLTGPVSHHSWCMRPPVDCEAEAAEREHAHAVGADGDAPRWNFHCSESATAWCVTFRDVHDARSGVQSMCGATREHCEYFRSNRFPAPGQAEHFSDVSECRPFE